MPTQAPLRVIKRWQRYKPRADWTKIPPGTRGFYVLYIKGGRDNRYDVSYIGVGGLGRKGSGIRSRIKSHAQHKAKWTHFSLFEVHDNIASEEIREMETLLLQIFRHDPRIQLTNVQTGSHKFYLARRAILWK